MVVFPVVLYPYNPSILVLPDNLNIDKLDFKKVEHLYKSKGSDNFARHCDWEVDDYVVSVFGWKGGKAGKENKTELPPPEDMDIFFGDILAVKSNKDGLLNFDKKGFEAFCEIAFGGFESLGDDDTDSENGENEYDSDDSFIASSDDFGNEDEEEEYPWHMDRGGRVPAAFGGIMGSDGRRAYGLGSLNPFKAVKKVGKAIKKVAKSPIGKALLAYATYKFAPKMWGEQLGGQGGWGAGWERFAPKFLQEGIFKKAVTDTSLSELKKLPFDDLVKKVGMDNASLYSYK